DIVIPENAETNPKGYMRKIYFPTNNISEEERKIFDCIKQINDIFSEERDMAVIINRLRLACTELSGYPNMPIRVDTASSTKSGNIGITSITLGAPTVSINLSDPPEIQALKRSIDDHKPGCIFSITSSSRIAENKDRIVRQVAIRHPDCKYDCMECFFRENGRLEGVVYLDKNLCQVGEAKAWAEDGTFLDKKVFDKPVPLKIQL
ncbi:MAG: hypothetical protein FWC50_15765, partial [Planctomycetaceae bacterium]|nr:hypothetical protein [Planctomycetaceae bacterium]